MILTYFPRRILVLGATGFVGERVCRRLRRARVDVVALTRFPRSPLADALRADGCEVREGDCLRRWTLWEALEGCDAVISCAHIRHAEALMQGCNRVGVRRLVCFSSTRRYSRVRDETVDACVRGELLLSQSELDHTVLRPSMIFGSSRDRNLFPVMQWMRRRPWVPVLGPGTAKVQPVFVEDVVTTVLDVLRRTDSIGRAYTLAGDEAMTWNAALETIAAAIDREVRLLHVPVGVALAAARLGGALAARAGVTREVVLRQQEDKEFDITEACAQLGFSPRPFGTAVAQMATGESETDAIYGLPGSGAGGSRNDIRSARREVGAGASSTRSPGAAD